LVTSPGMSNEGFIEAKFDPKDHPEIFRPIEGEKDCFTIERNEPFEIEKGWGGFIAFTRRGFTDLPAVGSAPTVDGTPMEQYCFSAPDHECPHCHQIIEGAGEDVMLYNSLRSVGLKACADPRIGTTHLKIAGLKSLRKGMPVKIPEKR
jgi:hypothetical protein